MKKKYFVVFIKRKMEFIPSSEREMKCPNSGFLPIIGSGEWGKTLE